MVKVKLKDLHVGYRLKKELKNNFLGYLKPFKESKSFSPDFSYGKFFSKVFWGSFGDKKAI